jgi:hypothetical protein
MIPRASVVLGPTAMLYDQSAGSGSWTQQQLKISCLQLSILNWLAPMLHTAGFRRSGLDNLSPSRRYRWSLAGIAGSGGNVT